MTSNAPIPKSWYIAQLKMLGARLLTIVPVLVACLAHAWKGSAQKSIKTNWPGEYAPLNGRPVDAFRWKWLGTWCDNPEDGSSGLDALVWGPHGQLMSYAQYSGLVGWRMSFSWQMRNSVQILKYRYAIPGDGPYKTFTLFGRTFGYGYKVINKLNCPVGPSRL